MAVDQTGSEVDGHEEGRKGRGIHEGVVINKQSLTRGHTYSLLISKGGIVLLAYALLAI